MIVSFRHKGLAELFKKGKTRKIDPKFWPKLQVMFVILNNLSQEEAIMLQPGWAPHKLTGFNPHGQSVNGHWSLKVSGNWRLTYKYSDGNVELTDFIDYH